mmetsp:Transcript_34102/g.63649  ORF Transcript_34102/g.63649 Transcript_34102/m.63649 type:complete len:129 (-) Transcript_34102:133-519(-)
MSALRRRKHAQLSHAYAHREGQADAVLGDLLLGLQALAAMCLSASFVGLAVQRCLQVFLVPELAQVVAALLLLRFASVLPESVNLPGARSHRQNPVRTFPGRLQRMKRRQVQALVEELEAPRKRLRRI